VPSSQLGTGGAIGPVTLPADASTTVVGTGGRSIAVDSGGSSSDIGGEVGMGDAIGADAPMGAGGVVATGGTVSTGGMGGTGGSVSNGGNTTTGTDWFSLPACGVTVQANINICGSPWPGSQTPCQVACTDNSGNYPTTNGKPCRALASGLYGTSWVVCIPTLGYDFHTNCEAYCPQQIAEAGPEAAPEAVDAGTGVIDAPLDVSPSLTQYILTASKSASGGGVIVSTPIGINCGTTCSEQFAAGSVIDLTATADATSVFTGWSGACVGNGVCTVNLDAAKSVVANFATRYVSVSAGESYTCGVRTDGSLACWGENANGQGAPPNGTFSSVSVGGVGDIVVGPQGGGGGNFACGVRTDGSVACWGDNASGQATPPTGMFSYVSAGGAFACGLRTDGTIACWGDNSQGQATPLTGTFLSVSAGSDHACAVLPNNEVQCWGNNIYGEAPYRNAAYLSVSAGYFYTCGVTTNSTIACWGTNNFGAVSTAPTGSFSSVSAYTNFACGVQTDNTIVCWGSGVHGLTVPTGIFSSVTVGDNYACGLRSDGTATCWGDNAFGQGTPD